MTTMKRHVKHSKHLKYLKFSRRKALAARDAVALKEAGDKPVSKITSKGSPQLAPERESLLKISDEKVGPSRMLQSSDKRENPQRKATTFRLDPQLQMGLVVLGQVLKQPLNRLINEAVRGFLERRSTEVEADLEQVIERLKAYRQKDPRFESAIAKFIEAEARLGHDDPVEGRVRPAAGPAQTMVHDLLRG